MTNLATAMRARTRESPESIFLIEAKTGRTWTYAEFDALTNGVAAGLVRAGVRPGDRVGTILPNGATAVALFLATLKIGAVLSPVNPAFTVDEVAYIVGHNRPRIVCSLATLADKLARMPPSSVAIVDGDAAGWFSVAESVPDVPEPSPNAPGLLLYTSGSTGHPKGALLTHDNLLTNAQEIARWLRLDARDRMMCVMPLSHANALVIGITTPLVCGASVVISERFSGTDFWPTVDRFRPTTFGSVATMLTRLLDRGAPPPGLSRRSLRFGLCGSAPVPVEVIKRFEATFGIPIIEGYGLTECTCRATFNPIDAPRPGSTGLSIGNEIKIVNDAGETRPVGTVGEVWIRGSNVMAGYFEAADATRAALAGGWLHTGDLGYFTADGFLYLVGRKSDMIIRGGENIYPREIEDVLYRMPEIREAAVIGLPDDVYGEVVVACLTAQPPCVPTRERVIDHCSRHLAPFKRPSVIYFLDQLPKGPTGKLLKNALRLRFALPSLTMEA